MSEDLVYVYRLEHKSSGIGPYRHHLAYDYSDFIYDMDLEHSNELLSTHPDPFRDGLGEMHPLEVAGFQSLEDLHDWFIGYLPTLADLGFVVMTYLVPKEDVRFGYYQVVFRRYRSICERFNARKEYATR